VGALLIPSSTSVGKVTVAAEFGSTDAGCSTQVHRIGVHQHQPLLSVKRLGACLLLAISTVTAAAAASAFLC